MDKPLSISDIDIVVFDLDGTIYFGPNIIPGANDTIGFLRDQGLQVFFATNNSTKSRRQIFDRLQGMGVDCKLDEVLTSGYLAAQYASRHGMRDVYIFGSQNLAGEFEESGIHVTSDENAENLLIGYDPDMTYEGLASAVRVAMRAKCVMACNRDRVYPGKDAKLMPGCGAMVAPVEWCAKRECDVVIGKPNPLMMKWISQHFDVNVRRILMVGDTFESDIRMAFLAGCKAVHISNKQVGDVPTIPSVALLPDIMDVAGKPVATRVCRKAEDANVISAAWNRLGDTHSVTLREQVDDYYAYICKLSNNAITYICEAGEEILGGISFYANDTIGGSAYVSHIAVMPKLRREGIGSNLLECACDNAKHSGMREVRADIPRGNGGAIALFSACGFELRQGSGVAMEMVKQL